MRVGLSYDLLRFSLIVGKLIVKLVMNKKELVLEILVTILLEVQEIK
jgi:hypothetical protein